MATLRRIKLNGLNAHITCTLCQGYYVEATTIIECLHTFCRTCIVRYLDTSTFCPVCDVQVHKTKPLLSLREDKTLQDVVYKLVPSLYRNEMQRRKEFYNLHPEAVGDRTEQSVREKRHFFHIDDQISLSLEFLPPAHAHAHALGLRPLRGPNLADQREQFEQDGEDDAKSGPKVPHKRFIKCQAAVQIRLLEKFIRLKYNLSDAHRVDIVHGSDCLSPELTLLDVVYTYKYAEDGPLVLQYTVIAPPPTLKRKKVKPSVKAGKHNDENDAKKQRLDTPLSHIENKEVSMNEDASSIKVKVEYEAELSVASGNKAAVDEDSRMVIDEIPPGDNNNVKCGENLVVKSNEMSISTSKLCEANSSIESLTKFVNSAPGLSGFQSEQSANAPLTGQSEENSQPENTNAKMCPILDTSISACETMLAANTKGVNSQCSLNSTESQGSPQATSQIAPASLNVSNATSIVSSAVKPSALHNLNSPVPAQIRHPLLSSPRVLLHRPSTVGFHQGNNVRYNSNIVSATRPVDPTKPRLGRPPNAARVAAAAAGRAVPQPILPRNPAARMHFTQNKQLVPNRTEGRGRPKKKPTLVPNNIPLSNNVPVSVLQPSVPAMQSCMPPNGNVSANSNGINAASSVNGTPQQNPSLISKITTSTSIAGPNTNSVLVNTTCDNVVNASIAPAAKSNGNSANAVNVASKAAKYMNKKPGNSSRLSSIADILLVSKQMSQMNDAKKLSDANNTLQASLPLPTASPTPATVAAMIPQMVPRIPFLPAVNPALAAAYMSDINVSNWLKLQTAAVIRGNLQALANQRTSPNKNDPKPMDLSPTNKNNISASHSTSGGCVSAVGSPLSYFQNAVSSNSQCHGQTSTTDSLPQPLSCVRKPKASEKDDSLEKLISKKFNNNNNISVLGNGQTPRNKNALETFLKSKANFPPNKVISALNNSPMTKCTSNNAPRMAANQVPLKYNAIVPRKNGMTQLKSTNCDKKACTNPVNSTMPQSGEKTCVGPVNSKLSGEPAQRSSPTPATAPSTRNHADGLNSVPSPKAAQSASPNSPSVPSTTISPPTPEVTITKLPNASTSTSVAYAVNAAVVTAQNHGTNAAKVTHTNTVSITKRPSTSIASVANKLAVRSPNACVRQIPNPSLLSQKSQVRNNNKNGS